MSESPEFGPAEREAAQRLIDLALAEDLDDAGDLTSQALIDESAIGTVDVVARRSGSLSGLPIVEQVFATLDDRVTIATCVDDGSLLERGTVVARLSGPTRSLLTGERTALNFLTHLSGVATLTRAYVDAAAGTSARILDTRKTIPGWRALHKYAVRCGGGSNHRMGLFDGVLIKDNHLAACGGSIAEAIRRAREFAPAGVSVEIEVDSLEQLDAALRAQPDIILLDNFSADEVRRAVGERNQLAPGVQLEVSGGVNLETVREFAVTGVERISVGALTHSAPALDLAFDWGS